MLQIDDLLLLKLFSRKKPQRFYKENGSKMKYRLKKRKEKNPLFWLDSFLASFHVVQKKKGSFKSSKWFQVV